MRYDQYGWKYAKAVESDLQRSTGMKPEVGFNWHNGRLETVTVTFPRIYEAKPLRELADTVRLSVNTRWGNQVRVGRHNWTTDELPLAVTYRAMRTARGSG